MSSRSALTLTIVLALAAIAWWIYLDRSYGYVPLSDSALYLDSALHLGGGQGARTRIGYPLLPSAEPLFPAFFHPPGGLVPYAPAALAEGSDRIAAALTVSLAISLGLIASLFVALRRMTGSLVIAAGVSIAYALDTQVLLQNAGIAPAVPFQFAIAVVAVLVAASAWPPDPRRAALIGGALGAAHFVRVNDVPILVVLAVALAIAQRWRAAAALTATYSAVTVMTLPFLPPMPSQGALLLADLPGYEGFSAAHLDPPTVFAALVGHWPALLRKIAANVLTDVLLIARSGDAFVVLPVLATCVAGALRGHRQLAVLLASYGASLLFISAIAVGTNYLAHFVLVFHLVAGVVIARHLPDVRAPMALAVVSIALASFGAQLREIDDGRDAVVARAHAYLAAAREVRRLAAPGETVISDAPASVGFHSERRAFNIPARFEDLGRVEREIGGARLVVLRRGQMRDVTGYPDPAWREAYFSGRIGDLVLTASVGEGDSEIRIWRRP